MNEDEFTIDFNIILRDITNTYFPLRENMSEEKLARKILGFLPKKFNMKVTSIEEAQDLSSIKFDEIIIFLQAFEMAINDRSEKKKKSIAFASNTEEDEDQGEENLSDVLALVGRKFYEALKRLDSK